MSDDLDAAPRCARCGYPLLHLPQTRCPECGKSFDLSDPTSFRPPPRIVNRNQTVQEVIVLISVSALFAARHHDIGELLYELAIEGAILFALALYFAVINDRFWLSPILFFVGFYGICAACCWREASLPGFPFLDCRLLVSGLVGGLFGAIGLVCMKAEEHSLQKKGETSRLLNFCDRIARSISLRDRKR